MLNTNYSNSLIYYSTKIISVHYFFRKFKSSRLFLTGFRAPVILWDEYYRSYVLLFDLGLRSNLVIILKDKELIFNKLIFKKNIFFLVSKKEILNLTKNHYLINHFKHKWSFLKFQEEFTFFIFFQFFLNKSILKNFYYNYKNLYFKNKKSDINNINFLISSNYSVLNNSTLTHSRSYWLFISYKLNVLLNSLDKQILNRFIRLRKSHFKKRRNRYCLNPFFKRTSLGLRKTHSGVFWFHSGFFTFMPRSFYLNRARFEKYILKSPEYANIFRNLNLILVLLWNFFESFHLRNLFFRGIYNWKRQCQVILDISWIIYNLVIHIFSVFVKQGRNNNYVKFNLYRKKFQKYKFSLKDKRRQVKINYLRCKSLFNTWRNNELPIEYYSFSEKSKWKNFKYRNKLPKFKRRKKKRKLLFRRRNKQINKKIMPGFILSNHFFKHLSLILVLLNIRAICYKLLFLTTTCMHNFINFLVFKIYNLFQVRILIFLNRLVDNIIWLLNLYMNKENYKKIYFKDALIDYKNNSYILTKNNIYLYNAVKNKKLLYNPNFFNYLLLRLLFNVNNNLIIKKVYIKLNPLDWWNFSSFFFLFKNYSNKTFVHYFFYYYLNMKKLFLNTSLFQLNVIVNFYKLIQLFLKYTYFFWNYINMKDNYIQDKFNSQTVKAFKYSDRLLFRQLRDKVINQAIFIKSLSKKLNVYYNKRKYIISIPKWKLKKIKRLHTMWKNMSIFFKYDSRDMDINDIYILNRKARNLKHRFIYQKKLKKHLKRKKSKIKNRVISFERFKSNRKKKEELYNYRKRTKIQCGLITQRPSLAFAIKVFR